MISYTYFIAIVLLLPIGALHVPDDGIVRNKIMADLKRARPGSRDVSHAMGEIEAAGAPLPDIEANGSDEPIIITPADALSVTVELDSGDDRGVNADWWIAVNAPSGWFYFNAYAAAWEPGFSVSYQGPLFDLPESGLFTVSGLPGGLYTFFFAVDASMNNILDYDRLRHDNIQVTVTREDGAHEVKISATGSVQNPVWSPDGESILCTMFRNGYNREPADLLIVDPAAGAVKTLASDGSGNINLPGAAWNPVTRKIVFSSSREPHDEIFIIDENGAPGDEIQITDRENAVAYEPSFSPDGQMIVFESHRIDVEGNGVITKRDVAGAQEYQALTDLDDDCRQPNWSPAGDLIVYQKFIGGQWDLWTMDVDGANRTKITHGPGDKTDASFSPDGQWIVYSSDEGELEYANLFIIPAAGGDSERATRHEGYDGAPSWSPDGKSVIFESCPGDPDDSAGATLWIIDVVDSRSGLP